MHYSCLLLISIPPSWRMFLTASTLLAEPSSKLYHQHAILARLLAERSRSPPVLTFEGPRGGEGGLASGGVICTHRCLPSGHCGHIAASLIRLPLNITQQWLQRWGVFLCVVGKGSLRSQLLCLPNAPVPLQTLTCVGQKKPNFNRPWAWPKWPFCLQLLFSESQPKSQHLTSHGWEFAEILGKNPCQNWNRDEINNRKALGTSWACSQSPGTSHATTNNCGLCHRDS